MKRQLSSLLGITLEVSWWMLVSEVLESHCEMMQNEIVIVMVAAFGTHEVTARVGLLSC